MTSPVRQFEKSILTALCVMSVFAVSWAHAAVPPDIAERLRQTAGIWQNSVAQQRQMQQIAGQSTMTDMSSAMNRQVYSSMMAQAVMEAIARNPADARDATNAAIQAAPALKADIVAHLSTAFPTMAATFAGSGRTPALRRSPPPQSEADLAASELIDDGTDDDPLEGFNRAMFAFNDFLDRYLLVPIAKVYRFVLPEPLRKMGRNFFENFNEPVVAINDALQGEFGDAGTALARFAVNSTVGLFGFFEVAEHLDLEEKPADFGQTLHTYGVESGPFIVLPFFGPSTLRDTVGSGVDSLLNPINYFLDFETRIYLKASEIVVEREKVLDPLEELRKGSLDYYSAVKSAWQQNRAKELRKGKPALPENLEVLYEDVK